MTGTQGETDLETAVRKLTAMSKLLEEFFEEAKGVPDHLTTAYAENTRLKIFPGLADLNFAAYNSATAIENLRKYKKPFDVVAASASSALRDTQG